MSTKIKKKLCWNCEGGVGYTEEHCPFCGVYLSPMVVDDNDSDDEEKDSPEQSPRSPYHLEGASSEDEVPPSPFNEHEGSLQAGGKTSIKAARASSEELRKMITPMGLLSMGSAFSLFGLILLLFGKEGRFTLQWNSEYWYLYLIASLGMLFWGWRSLQLVDE